MAKLDPFTARRLTRFVEEFRAKSGVLPTLQNLGENGFAKELVATACRDKVIEEFYVTLTNGTIMKGYKVVT